MGTQEHGNANQGTCAQLCSRFLLTSPLSVSYVSFLMSPVPISHILPHNFCLLSNIYCQASPVSHLLTQCLLPHVSCLFQISCLISPVLHLLSVSNFSCLSLVSCLCHAYFLSPVILMSPVCLSFPVCQMPTVCLMFPVCLMPHVSHLLSASYLS